MSRPANHPARAVVQTRRLMLALILAGGATLPLADGAAAMTSCAAEIGQKAADKLVKRCIAVSPATHPPCNAANSCALVKDEIARSCALFNDGSTPLPAECTVPPGSARAAVDVVKRYYAAISAGDYGTAYQQWGDDGRPGQSFTDFQRGFAHTRSTSVTFGEPGLPEGAAGSIYITVPVTIEAILDDGSRQHFKGSYVLRRINGQGQPNVYNLDWHLASARLQAS